MALVFRCSELVCVSFWNQTAKTQTAVVLCLFALHVLLPWLMCYSFAFFVCFCVLLLISNGFLFVAQQTTAVIFYVDDALIVCVFFLVAVSSRRVAHIRYIHTFIIIILWFRSWLLLCPLSLMPLKNIFVFRSDSFDSTQFFQECRVAQPN